MLFWMGDHYAEYVVAELKERIKSEIIAIKCEFPPELSSAVATKLSNRVKAVCAKFHLQVLVKGQDGGHVRVHLVYQADAKNLLETPNYFSSIQISKQENV